MTAQKDPQAKCPFVITPEVITFRNYDVGGIYEVQVVMKNASKIGRHVLLHAAAAQSHLLLCEM